MGGFRQPGPLGSDSYDEIAPALTAGSLGLADCADPDVCSEGGYHAGVVGLLGGAGVGPGLFHPIVVPPPAAAVTAARASTLSPHDYAQRYQNLTIAYTDPEHGAGAEVTVNVHRYANNGITNRRGNMREKDKLVSLVRAELRRGGESQSAQVERGHVRRIAHAFFAKGRPEDYAVALGHALRYGRARAESLQHYCDDSAKLGLDCSGFVNNYLLEIGRISAAQTISSYGRGTLRQRTADIQPLDVLLWLENDGSAGGHIAIVDSLAAQAGSMLVVESSGSKEGLASTIYQILEVQNGVFRVDRGPTASGHRSVSRVRIAAV